MPAMSAQPPSRLPWSVLGFVVVSWILGWMLVLDGLQARLWGSVFSLGGWMGWAVIAQTANLSLWDVGWPLLCVGCGLLGASFALVFGRRWGLQFGVAFSCLALGYFYFGSLLALICLALLFAPATQAHIRNTHP